MTLDRFVEAQAPVYARALAELKAGRKQSHWMWFVFPQIVGLGHSAMAKHYATQNLAEARAYLANPILGARLHECTQTVLDIEDRTAHEIFGSPDDLKFRSSMTLFDLVTPNGIFCAALDKYFDGQPDKASLELLAKCD